MPMTPVLGALEGNGHYVATTERRYKQAVRREA